MIEVGDLSPANPNRRARREGTLAEYSSLDLGAPLHELELPIGHTRRMP
jgi:hypothetical protein